MFPAGYELKANHPVKNTPGVIIRKECIPQLLKRRDVKKLLHINSARTDPRLVSTEAYQRLFKGYYKVRRGRQFTEPYLHLLQHDLELRTTPSLKTIVLQSPEQTGQRHLSFASKLLATLDDTEPLYDQNVCSLLGVPHHHLKGSDWLERAEERIRLLKQGVADITSASSWPSHEAAFNTAFPEALQLSSQRKADLMTWASSSKTR